MDNKYGSNSGLYATYATRKIIPNRLISFISKGSNRLTT